MRADPARAEALSRLLETPLGRVERDGGDRSPQGARVRELVAGVRRHLFTIDAVLEHYLPKGLARVEARLVEALHLGTYQILFERHVAKPLVVASTVPLAGTSAKKRGFLNAVLRRIAGDVRDETGALPRRASDCVIVGAHAFARFPRPVIPDADDDLVQHLGSQFSQTPWFVEAMMREVGDAVDDLLLALALPLPIALRVNRLRASPVAVEAALIAAGAQVVDRFGDVLLTVRYAGAITECAPFRDGWVTVQDRVASEVAPFVGPVAGERILDLCAGSGGKSTHLAEVSGGGATITASDVSAAQLLKLAENVARLGTPGIVPLHLEDGTLEALPPFDRVLIDAPCSNSGVLMKRVAARYRLAAETVRALSKKQLDLLHRGGGRLRAGGVLVYSTCSILPQENRAVIERFLEETKGAFSLEETRLSYPHETRRDGGFMARLRKA